MQICDVLVVAACLRSLLITQTVNLVVLIFRVGGQFLVISIIWSRPGRVKSQVTSLLLSQRTVAESFQLSRKETAMVRSLRRRSSNF